MSLYPILPFEMEWSKGYYLEVVVDLYMYIIYSFNTTWYMTTAWENLYSGLKTRSDTKWDNQL